MKISDNVDFFNGWQELMHQNERVLIAAHKEDGKEEFKKQIEILIGSLQSFKSNMTGETRFLFTNSQG